MDPHIRLRVDSALTAPSRPSVFGPTSYPNQITINPFDFLVRVGTLTTPLPNYAFTIRSFHAYLRYMWAISSSSPDFRLRHVVKDIDFRLKGLMSEDFGIGFAGVFVQDYLGFPIACHTSTYFFNRPPGTSISSKACPDFLFHRPGWPSRWITVEAKGTQTSVGQSNKQIASGKAKQIYPFLKDHPGYHGIVVGTFISREGYNSPSRIRVVDPSLKKRRKRVKEVDSLRVAKLHYYRIAAALSEVQVSSEDWQELGIQEMFQRSGLVEKRKIADATWWHRRIEVPNSPPLPWIDGGADVISIDIGMPSFLIDLIDQSKLPEEWDLAIERLDPRPIFDLYKDTKFTIPVWSRKYGDGVAVSVSVRGKKQTRVRSVS